MSHLERSIIRRSVVIAGLATAILVLFSYGLIQLACAIICESFWLGWPYLAYALLARRFRNSPVGLFVYLLGGAAVCVLSGMLMQHVIEEGNRGGNSCGPPVWLFIFLFLPFVQGFALAVVACLAYLTG